MKLFLAFLLCCLTLFTTCNEQYTASYEHSASHSPGTIVDSIGNSVFIIFHDQNNTYWFGSNGQGVYRYDGEVITHYTTQHGLCHDQIRGIQEDQHGRIYFETTNGISQFDGKIFTTLALEENEPPTNNWQLNPTDLWFKGGAKGPYRFDGEKLYRADFPTHHMEEEFRAQIPNAPYSPYEVYHIYKDKRGHLWFGTSNFGLCRYDGTRLSWMYERHLSMVAGGGSFGIRSIIEDQNGDYWICNPLYRYDFSAPDSVSNGQGFLQYDRKPGAVDEVEGMPYFMSMIEDEKGNLWMVTYDEGVYCYDGRNLLHYSVKKEGRIVKLFSIYKDRHGQLWLGTHNDGPYVFDGERFMPYKP